MRQNQRVGIERLDMRMIVIYIVDGGAFLFYVRSRDSIEMRMNQAAMVVIVVACGMDVPKRRHCKSKQHRDTRLQSDQSAHSIEVYSTQSGLARYQTAIF